MGIEQINSHLSNTNVTNVFNKDAVQKVQVNRDSTIDDLLLKAMQFANDGDKETAIEYYNKVLDLDAYNPKATTELQSLYSNIYNIVITLVDSNQKSKAINVLRELTGLQIKDASDVVKVYDETKNWQLAKRILDSKLLFDETVNRKKLNPIGCYIATAVYGYYDAPEVLILRKYRDEVLQQTILGRAFIKTYYFLSPPIANWLKDAKRINTIVKNLLDIWVNKLIKKYESSI